MKKWILKNLMITKMMRMIRFIKALVKYIIFGKRVEFADYIFRLRVCNECPLRDDWKCGKCGCYLDKKAKMSTETCPEGNWE